MKKNIFIALICSFLMLIAQTSCDNYNDQFLDDYSTILYFKNSGDIPLTLYRTGQDDTYRLVVNKSGSETTAQTDVSVVLMDDNALAIYNSENETAYKKLPSNCYVLPSDMNCSFGSGDLFKFLDITMKTEAIYQLMLANPNDTYVLPFQLINSKDSINSVKNLALVTPTVEIPTVYFTKTGFSNTSISKNDPNEITLTLPIELIVDNKWDFNCSVSVYEKALEDYNAENKTAFRLLPSNAYSINNTVTFVPGKSAATVNIAINRSSLGLGTYILPLKLNDCSQEYFYIDETKNICLFGVSYTPPRADLVRVPLTVEQLSTNAQDPGEGPIANLIDGNTQTFFHSNWHNAVYSYYGHYIDFNMGTEANAVAFNFTTRHNNANGTPSLVKLYGSPTGADDTWELIGIIAEGMPTTVATSYSSDVFAMPTKFKYFRFAVNESKGGKMDETSSASFALAEFQLFAQ